MFAQSPAIVSARSFLPGVSAAQVHISARLLGRRSSIRRTHITWLGLTKPKVNDAALIVMHNMQGNLAVSLHSQDPAKWALSEDTHTRLLGYVFAAGDVIGSIEALTDTEFTYCELMKPTIEATSFDVGVIAQVSSEEGVPQLFTLLLSSQSGLFGKLLRMKASVNYRYGRRHLSMPLNATITCENFPCDFNALQPGAWMLLHALQGKSATPISLLLPTGVALCNALYEYGSHNIVIPNIASKSSSKHESLRETEELKLAHIESSDTKTGQNSSSLFQPEQVLAINNRVVIELGSIVLSVEELLAVTPGQIFPLGKQLSDRYVAIKVNNKVIAHGELALLGDNLCVRVAIVESGHESL